MNIVERFNNLDGKRLTRKDVESLVEEANKEGQTIIEERLKQVLINNPESESFLFEVKEKEEEIFDSRYLGYIDELPEGEEFENEDGLGKKISPKDIYNMVYEKMKEAIKEAKGDWDDGLNTNPAPINFVTKKRYRGINYLLLSLFGFKTFKNPYFMTFKQVKEKKGTIKKGAKSYKIIYFTRGYYAMKEGEKVIVSKNKEEVEDYLKKNKIETKIGSFPVLRYYNVFNGEDIEGINFGEIKGNINEDEEKNEVAELIIKKYKNSPEIKHGGRQAYYSPKDDFVQMPNKDEYKSVNNYYATLFHELIHSTGHEKRLNRLTEDKFGSKGYALEELIAESGATFLNAHAGILLSKIKNSALYLKGWNSVLEKSGGDGKFLIIGASLGQKAVDYILDMDKNGVYAYEKELKKKIKVKKEVKIKTQKTEKEKDVEVKKDREKEVKKFKERVKGKVEKRKETKLKDFLEKHFKKARLNTNFYKHIAEKFNIDIEKAYVFEEFVYLADTPLNSFYNSIDTLSITEFVFGKSKKNNMFFTDFKQDKEGYQFEFTDFSKEIMSYIIKVRKYKKYQKTDDQQEEEELSKEIKLEDLDLSNFIKRPQISTFDKYGELEKEDPYFINWYPYIFMQKGIAAPIKKIWGIAGYDAIKVRTRSQRIVVKNSERKPYLIIIKKNAKIEDFLKKDKGLSLPTAQSKSTIKFNKKKNDKKSLETAQLGIAPNGKKSNLTAKQWEMVRTKEFKKWFGDWENDPENASKVVDENGEPLVVYHGTEMAGFKEFFTGYPYGGSYFSEKKSVASGSSGNKTIVKFDEKGNHKNKKKEGIYEVFLNIRNPEVFDFKGRDWDKYVKSYGVFSLDEKLLKSFYEIEEAENYALFLRTQGKEVYTEYINNDNTTDNLVKSVRKTKDKDGVYFLNVRDNGDKKKTKANNWVVFSPKQIKSATDNNGKFDPNEPSFLAGVTKKGLGEPEVKEEVINLPAVVQKRETSPKKESKNNLANIIANNNNYESFVIDRDDMYDFLGDLEIKKVGSLIITMTGRQGCGKTRFSFQFMNDLAQNYSVGHISNEEHPLSRIYQEKALQYMNQTALNNITSIDAKSLEDIDNIIKNNDVIVIDSFQKLKEIYPKIEIDKDLRRKYNGKLILIIFQQTASGQMRGGSRSQFDGDIILFTKTFEDYRENYVYPDKNRYNSTPATELKYNIANCELQRNYEIEEIVININE